MPIQYDTVAPLGLNCIFQRLVTKSILFNEHSYPSRVCSCPSRACICPSWTCLYLSKTCKNDSVQTDNLILQGFVHALLVYKCASWTCLYLSKTCKIASSQIDIHTLQGFVCALLACTCPSWTHVHLYGIYPFSSRAIQYPSTALSRMHLMYKQDLTRTLVRHKLHSSRQSFNRQGLNRQSFHRQGLNRMNLNTNRMNLNRKTPT